MADLKEMTILITGASRGIGAAVATTCLESGANILLHANAPSDAADATAQALGKDPSAFLFEDFTTPGAGHRLFERALERADKIDAVVNNAGIYSATPLAGSVDQWERGWDASIAVNVRAPADICRCAIAHFRKREKGIIVNIASRAGHRGDGPDYAAYAASKGAVLAMTKTWALALAGENILLFGIAPGWVETRMVPQDVEARKEAAREIPLGRVAAPSEVAAMIVFLLQGDCPSATGATFDINGASYVR